MLTPGTTRLECPIQEIYLNRIKFMELFIILVCVIFVIFYLFRPTSKKEKDHFDDKNNWRGGF